MIKKSDEYLADKDSENSKKFLTMSSKYDIIHTVRNEASNKVSGILEKRFKKELETNLKKFLTNASEYDIIRTVRKS